MSRKNAVVVRCFQDFLDQNIEKLAYQGIGLAVKPFLKERLYPSVESMENDQVDLVK